MMRSVSISLPRTGIARPRISRIRSMANGGLRGSERPHVDHLARDRRGRDHRRAHEQRAPGGTALAALEIPVRRRRADLAAFEAVRIHRETHRAARPAPFEAGVKEYAVEPFALRRRADGLRPRHDERLHVRRDMLSAYYACRLPQIRQARV